MRAINVLKTVPLIAAEDTRRTRKLLNHYGIGTSLTSYHEHNDEMKGKRLLSKLEEGIDIALVSDAGTPGISDPGYRLVRLAIGSGIEVVPIPGPSAVIAVLSVSGLPTDSFRFEGFAPPRKTKRRTFILGLKGLKKTVVLYEAPNRLKGLLEDLIEILGDPKVVVAREMTKIHEDLIRGRASEVLERFEGREVKGEVVVAIGPQEAVAKEDIPLAGKIEHYTRQGFSLKDAVKAVVEETGLPRREVYMEAVKTRGRKERLG